MAANKTTDKMASKTGSKIIARTGNKTGNMPGNKTGDETAEAARAGDKAIDDLNFRRVMGRFPSGVTIITAAEKGQMRGMTANAFMSGSMAPPLCIVSIAKRAALHEVLMRGKHFGVNILAQGQENLSQHFAGKTIAGLIVPFTTIAGVPLLTDASAYIAARITARHDCGDHTLFVGHILAMDADERQPLVYHAGRYAQIEHRPVTQQIIAPSFW